MDLWVIWLLVGLAFAAGEIASVGFFLAPFAGGAFLAAAVDLTGAPDWLSVAMFFVASALLFGVVRPIARRHVSMPPQLRTGTQALVGKTAVALAEIDQDSGSVKLGGEVWSARCYDEGEVIPVGARVQVVEIKGATALVIE
jgi:membrane protein implicated in regulation of membrane protease activity